MTRITRNNRFQPAELLEDETIFSIANGYLGTRGTFCEGYGTPFDYPQTLLNGVYDFYDYHYEENLSGFPQQGQKIVNLYDGTRVEFQINDTLLNLSNATVVSLERAYHLADGYTSRTIEYEWDGYHFTLQEKRLVARETRYVISQDITLSTTDYSGLIGITSWLRQAKKPILKDNDPRVHQGTENAVVILKQDPEVGNILFRTTRSQIEICSAVTHNITMESRVDETDLKWNTDMTLSPSEPIHLVKHTIHTSDLYESDYRTRATSLQQDLTQRTFESLLQSEAASTNAFWQQAYVRIPSNQTLEEKLHYNMFQLNRQGGEHPLHNIAAKGLSGEGYEGHYFWDTEIYMMPFFLLTQPDRAKQLLLYRYHKLDAAKQEAKNLGYHQGAKIPWRTINGDETSPYYPAGSAQFHINSDVAYATIKYLEVTDDLDFLVDCGFELLLETARFLAQAVNEHDGVYHLNSVTGPDEYTTVVDDNCYTNFMLQYHFRKLVDYYHTYSHRLSDTITTLGVDPHEMALFQDISERITLPYDDELGIYVQDNSFLHKKRLDIQSIPKENFPLLLYYHPLFLYKHQVLKQADTMLAMLLLDEFDSEVVRRSYEYYEPITTHDSSLSKCIYSILGFQLGLIDQAEEDLQLVLDTDLSNVHHNTKDGLHVANMGGSYMGFLYGLVGLRIHQDYISLYPRVSKHIEAYDIRFMYHGHLVSVSVDHMVNITSTAPMRIKLYGEWVDLDQSYETKTRKN